MSDPRWRVTLLQHPFISIKKKLGYSLYYVKDVGICKRIQPLVMNLTDKDCKECDELLRSSCSESIAEDNRPLCSMGYYKSYMRFRRLSIYVMKFMKYNLDD